MNALWISNSFLWAINASMWTFHAHNAFMGVLCWAGVLAALFMVRQDRRERGF